MDATQILNALPEFGATKEIEPMPGMHFVIRPIQSYAEYVGINKTVATYKTACAAGVDIGDGVTVTVDEETIQTCLYVMAGLVSPVFTFPQIVALGVRGGMLLTLLYGEILKFTSGSLGDMVDAAGAEVAQDPFPPAVPVGGDEDADTAIPSGGLA